MKPPLTVLHRKQRLEWCKLRENWTVEQWRSVIFSDESAFSLLPTTTRTFVRRRPHEGTSASCLSPSLKWRTPKLMVWGAISGQGVGPLHRCTGNVNQHVYKAMLEQYHGYLAHRQLVQDNAPCHKTNLIRNWMLENAVNAIPWPSCSPDLNPIEQVWAWMKRQIQGRHFASKDDLWHALHSLWLQMSPDFIQRFVDSMPRRLKAVIIAKGGVTRY
jgi:transposase